jgi:hypothetical protein
MLKQQHYDTLAIEFQTDMGIMEWDGGSVYPHYPNITKMPDEFKVILLTKVVVNEGIYQKVIKEVMRLESKYGKRNIKKSTLYEKALNNLMEQNEIHSII